MQVRLSDLPEHGLTINDTIPLAPLNARLNEAPENDIIFLEAPRVELQVQRAAPGARTVGRASTRYRQPCARCLKELEQPLEVPLSFVLKPHNLNSFKEEEDDIGIVYFEGDSFDFEDLIQETLILSLSPFLQPPLRPDGSCQLCGYTLAKINPDSNKQSLGALLAQAGVTFKNK